MYKAKMWDEDKWNIHSSSYNSSKYSSTSSDDKKEDKKYHEQKYGDNEKSLSSDYIKKEEKDAASDDKKNNSIFDDIEEGRQKEQNLNDEDIPFRAAKQIFNEKKHEAKKTEPKKEISSIEDAIKKAIEQEKKIIIMDS